MSKKGINITIIDARFSKPLDEKLIMEVATNHELIITIEEGSIGGFGSHVAHFTQSGASLIKELNFEA